MRTKHQAKKKPNKRVFNLLSHHSFVLCHHTNHSFNYILNFYNFSYKFIHLLGIYQFLVFLISLLLYNHDKTRLRRHAMASFNQNLKNTILLYNFDYMILFYFLDPCPAFTFLKKTTPEHLSSWRKILFNCFKVNTLGFNLNVPSKKIQNAWKLNIP